MVVVHEESQGDQENQGNHADSYGVVGACPYKKWGFAPFIFLLVQPPHVPHRRSRIHVRLRRNVS